MASTSLAVRRDGGIVVATLNRPDKLNALNKDVFDELKRLVDVLETDKTVRALIMTGSGEKAFCVGADLKERQGMNEKDILVRLEFVRSLYLRLERLPVPTIAAINGSAMGGGLELALACDLRIASDNATLSFPEVDLAIIPGNGGTQRLSRVIGLAKTLEMVLLGKRLTANEAFGHGMVNMVVANGQAVVQAMSWAGKIAEAGPIAIRNAKNAIRVGYERSLEEGLSLEIDCYKACLYSKDRLEGLKAFSEKRKAVYRGE